MRTYFILAALMGVFAFGSISLLAHAQDADEASRIAAPAGDEAAAVTDDGAGTATDEAPAEEVPTGPSPEDVKRDANACKKEAYGRPRGQRDQRTQEERDGQYVDCMSSRGYTSDEIDSNK